MSPIKQSSPIDISNRTYFSPISTMEANVNFDEVKQAQNSSETEHANHEKAYLCFIEAKKGFLQKSQKQYDLISDPEIKRISTSLIATYLVKSGKIDPIEKIATWTDPDELYGFLAFEFLDDPENAQKIEHFTSQTTKKTHLQR